MTYEEALETIKVAMAEVSTFANYTRTPKRKRHGEVIMVYIENLSN